MCRKNLLYAGALIAFGAGVLVSLFIESALFCFAIGLGTICGGVFLLKK